MLESFAPANSMPTDPFSDRRITEREVNSSSCPLLRARNLTAASACPSLASKASDWSAGIPARKACAVRSSTGSRFAAIAGRDARAPFGRSLRARTPALQQDATTAKPITIAGMSARTCLVESFISSAALLADTCEAYSLKEKGSSVIEHVLSFDQDRSCHRNSGYRITIQGSPGSASGIYSSSGRRSLRDSPASHTIGPASLHIDRSTLSGIQRPRLPPSSFGPLTSSVGYVP